MTREHAQPGPRERLREEMREFFVVFVYLYVCFGAVLLFKAAVLRDAGIAFAPFGMAAIKAAIMAKFILIGQMTPVDRRGTSAPLVWAIVRKSIGFLVLLIALTAIEHLLERWWHGKGLPHSIAGLGDVAVPEMLTHSLLMLLVLIPYIAYREIDIALGPGRMRRLLLQGREAAGFPSERG